MEEDSSCVSEVTLPDIREVECPITSGASLIAHPEDCRFYFICIDGKQAALKRCGNTMLFDVDQDRCVEEERASCIIGPRTV